MLYLNTPLVQYTLLTARRDWLFIGIYALLCLAASLAIFCGHIAFIEPVETVMLFLASTARLTMVVGTVVFVCFHVHRLYEHQEIEVILTRSLSRAAFIGQYWMGFVALNSILVVPITAIMALWSDVPSGVLYWGIGVLGELCMLSAFALTASLILRSAVCAVLVSYAFYILARISGFLLLSLVNMPPRTLLDQIVGRVIETVSMLLPRLDLFAQSKWVIYGLDAKEWIWLLPVQTLVYIPLLLSMAMMDIKRKIVA